MQIGYARISAQGQKLEAQLKALEAAGCERTYREKASGAERDRPHLKALLKALEVGDVVVVTRLDRLARSTRELLEIVDTVAERGAAFRSLAESWADTTTPAGKMMLTVLSGLAEFERSLIQERTAEGRALAVERGVRMGRPPALDAGQHQEARKLLAEGKTAAEIGRLLGVSRSTVSRLRA